MKKPLLSIRDLRIRFAVHGADVEAVRGVSFDIQPGAAVALVGESGSGKSVISRAVLGLLPSTASITCGKIILHDPNKGIESTDIVTLPPDSSKIQALRGGSISLIFQEPMVSLSALHTIGDQISEALLLHREVSKAEGAQLTREMLETVGFPDPSGALSRYPFELSGGMRQRAMIAMALICHPSLLIADEPTTALDVTIQAQILKLMRRLQQRLNMAVLMITHDLGVVANVAEEVVVLYHGEVMESGAVADIFGAPQHPYTRALLKAVPRFNMRRDERLTPLREIESDAAPFLRAAENQNRRTHAPPPALAKDIIKVRDVCQDFSVRSSAWSLRRHATLTRAVREVSFSLVRGECLGLVGESGSGKSTLGKLIARAMPPTRGEIVYYGEYGPQRVDALGPEQLLTYRRQVQYIFQDPVGSLNPSMTLFDIIREPMEIHQLGDLAYQMEMCKELMRMVGLDPRFLRRYPHSFSGGQRQRVGIARALALRPKLLICDEPVSALDVSIQAQVLNLLKDLQKELDLSYLFISHNLAVVDYIADRIAVMYRGELVEIAPRESLFQHPTHPYTRALLRAVPVADPNQPLDFARIAEPTANPVENGDWAPPFATEANPDGGSGALFEIATGHWVRAGSDPRQYQPTAAA